VLFEHVQRRDTSEGQTVELQLRSRSSLKRFLETAHATDRVKKLLWDFLSPNKKVYVNSKAWNEAYLDWVENGGQASKPYRLPFVALLQPAAFIDTTLI